MNRCILLGNLVRDPEIKTLPTGTQVCNFAIAITEYYNKEKTAHFFECKSFGKTAENISKYFSKGRPILIECKANQERWEKDGEKKSRVVFIVERFEFLPGGKKENQEDSNPFGE